MHHVCMAMTTLSIVVIPANEALPLSSSLLNISEGLNIKDLVEKRASIILGDSTRLAPLLLPSSDTAGLYVYSIVPPPPLVRKNVRATRLAMACGKLGTRFHGDVMLFRSKGAGGYQDLVVSDVYGAACVSPDLRLSVQTILNTDENNDRLIPEWLANAAQQNYHDNATISRLASVMSANTNDGFDESDSSESSQSESEEDDSRNKNSVKGKESVNGNLTTSSQHHFIARTPLCLHCRGPCDTLCPGCEGAYFCNEPHQCREIGWSHECLCPTWKAYTDRRSQLSSFPFDEWYLQLIKRDCQISEEPYQRFLTQQLGIRLDESSWWRTELHGWSGGESQSAQTVDATKRRSFEQGFVPITTIPSDEPVTIDDCARLDRVSRNACGLMVLNCWKQYYELRNIPLSSPVALLLTFPLSIYHAIVKFGEVPVTVARMLKRPLRLHVVGIEKEMNFLDLFREVGYLLPNDLSVEFVFVVRKDMLPPKSRAHGSLEQQLTDNLKLLVVSGTYGDNLNPYFDCGSGPPDMVIGLNAGLFAYESWRFVITYLYENRGCVGVFTDYNEHSGMHCASLGGSKSRESLCINPFRQPRAMPVLSMNLPQFSNGFMYAYNLQELE